jgi:hypothetical protein
MMTTEQGKEGVVVEGETVEVSAGETPVETAAEAPWEDFNSNWDDDGLDEDLGDGETSVVPEVTPAAAPVVEAPVVEPVAPTVTPVAAPEPVVPAPAPTPVVPTPTPVPTTSTPVEPLPIRDTLLSQLEKTYAISEDDVDALRLEPETVLPKLAARIAVDSYERVFGAIVAQLPTLVTQTLRAQSETESLETEFYSKNPGLGEYAKANGREKVDAIAAQAAVLIRSQNPSIAKDDLIKLVGSATEAMLGLPSRTGGPSAAPVAERVVEEVVRRPFTPALGASAGAPQVNPPLNPFEALNAALDDLDNDFGD